MSNYNRIKLELEKITNYSIPEGTTIVIGYHFKDDLCSNGIKNKWYRVKINNVKRNLKPYINQLKDKNAIYISLFENGMILKTKPNLKYEYFFVDNNNFFRKSLFIKKSFCGSSAAIKPNGETLIVNSEGSILNIIINLENENWNRFFITSN
ncbi:MAG: hypothetical protein HKP48_06070 [Winogradskyella sp.]|uniref:hypothetical protein n=1 Tax=Winogradskyella sp. TaxID=1883156 RepID=UPI0017DBFBF3|nr:hypothetical protein [Winogradskyella sp.]MBT8245592.1 hypothetical protein [Winogradskyella sp.]NNK22862.1 hypothetical protein [Winogradskyella sp.]